MVQVLIEQQPLLGNEMLHFTSITLHISPPLLEQTYNFPNYRHKFLSNFITGSCESMNMKLCNAAYSVGGCN